MGSSLAQEFRTVQSLAYSSSGSSALKHSFDYIVAGAGCAGLSFLWYALDSPLQDARILLVDRDLSAQPKKTWCFWGNEGLPFRHIADHSWDRMAVGFPNQRVEERLDRNVYHCVRSEVYHEHVMERIRAHPNVTLLTAEINELYDTADGAVLKAGGQSYTAGHIFQSCFVSPRDNAQPVHYPLRQHFGGWEVETATPTFDPDVVTLMDFDTAQQGATVFYYILPFTPTRALVEYTVFSPDPWDHSRYDAAIHRYIREHTDAPYDIIRREYGVIPMEERPRHQRYGQHITSLGTVGGITKPTTGYTFQRVHQHTQQLVRTMMSDGHPDPVAVSSPRYRFYDLLLLRILHEHPRWGRPIFQRLFAHNSIDRVLSFIGEDTHLGQDMRIFSQLPYGPFLRAIAPNLPLMPRVLFPEEPAVGTLQHSATPPDPTAAVTS